MQWGPRVPRWSPGLWELKLAPLAGTKGRPPLPLAPCLSHRCPSPPHNKRGHGALIPRQRYKWWPPTPEDEAGTNGPESRKGCGGWRNGKKVIKDSSPLPHPHPRGPFVGWGERTRGWGLRQLGWEDTKDRSEWVAGVKTSNHPLLKAATKTPYQIQTYRRSVPKRIMKNFEAQRHCTIHTAFYTLCLELYLVWISVCFTPDIHCSLFQCYLCNICFSKTPLVIRKDLRETNCWAAEPLLQNNSRLGCWSHTQNFPAFFYVCSKFYYMLPM